MLVTKLALLIAPITADCCQFFLYISISLQYVLFDVAIILTTIKIVFLTYLPSGRQLVMVSLLSWAALISASCVINVL